MITLLISRIRKQLLIGGLVIIPILFTVYFLALPRNRYVALPKFDSLVDASYYASDGGVVISIPNADERKIRVALRTYFYLDDYIQYPQGWKMTVSTDSTIDLFEEVSFRGRVQRALPIEIAGVSKSEWGADSVYLIDRNGWIRGRYGLFSPLLVTYLRDDIIMLYYEYQHPNRVVQEGSLVGGVP